MGNSVKVACACCKPAPTTLVKKYDVPETNMLGQGTFAKVYKGTNRKTNEEVAVKCIDKANTRRDLLNTEIWILQNLSDHPNIVKCYDMFETEDEVQLVMEIMEGGELFDLLDEHGPYGEVEASKYFLSIVAGLAYLHKGGVVHRDLKPENLLLSKKGPAGVLKISDFGLAKILTPEDDGIMKVACGTWIYCAPEVLQLKRKKKGHYDSKCDIFSIGCILFIIMGGYHPFDYDGNDDEELMEECIIEDTWDFNDPAWKDISYMAKDLIENMLKKEPRERMSAAELRDHPWTVGKIPKVDKTAGALPKINENPRKIDDSAESVGRPLLDNSKLQDDDLENEIALALGGHSEADNPPITITKPKRPSVTSTDSRASGVKKAKFPAAIAFEERRASGDVRRMMPKKDRKLDAGDKTETPDMFFKARGAAAVRINRKAPDNDSRWDKFNNAAASRQKANHQEDRRHEKTLEKSPTRNLQHFGAPGDTPKVVAPALLSTLQAKHRQQHGDVSPSPRSNQDAVDATERQSSDSPSRKPDTPPMDFSPSGSAPVITRMKSDRSLHVKKTKTQKYATQQMATRQFANVDEWKAKQAPKLLAKATQLNTTLNVLKAMNKNEPGKGDKSLDSNQSSKGAAKLAVKKLKPKTDSKEHGVRKLSVTKTNSRRTSQSKTSASTDASSSPSRTRHSDPDQASDGNNA